LEWYNLLLVFFYMIVISLGLGSAWKRWRWLGLLPLVFSLGYSIATAIGRFSGWRYDLPADWIWYFYFGIGFAELLFHAALVLGAKAEQVFRPERREDANIVRTQTKRPFQEIGSLVVLFAFIGSFPWLIENIASPRYTDQSQTALEEKMAALPNAPTFDELSAFASQPETFLQMGRVLYPRFFSKNDGLASTNPWPAYAFHDFPRIGFLLLNQTNVSVVFPTKKIAEFPHAAAAIVLGCQRDGYVEARWVAFPALDLVYSSDPLKESCSP
jgi:hypothetical protein